MHSPHPSSQPAPRPGPRKIAALIAIGALVLGASVAPALAKETRTMLSGVTACKAECDRINRTINSQHICYVNCERYWMCHGRDSTATTCADRPSVGALEQAPTAPPKRRFENNRTAAQTP